MQPDAPGGGWPPAPAPARPRWPWLNALLLAATAATTLLAGALLAAPGAEALTPAGVVRHGWPYAAALFAILGAHEMGHWLLARRHGVDATLPFFIPGPPPFGTLGAVIRLRSLPPSRRATLDIGVAGPIAGFAVAVPVLLWGLAHSTLVEGGVAPRSGLDSPLQLLLAWWEGRPTSGGEVLQYALGESLAMKTATWAVWGDLAPGQHLLLHPVGLAGWLGLLVTALNLVPLGQLDGGHCTYALLGAERALRLSRLVSWGLLACGLLLSWNWLAWWALTRFVVRPGHPRAWDERPLDPARRALAIAGLVLFVLTFVPVPFSV